MLISVHCFTVRIPVFMFMYVHSKKYRIRTASTREASLHEDLKKSATVKKRGLISSKIRQCRANLISRNEFVSSVSYKFLPNTHLYFLIACIHDDTCHFCYCACYCTTDNRYYPFHTTKAKRFEVETYTF